MAKKSKGKMGTYIISIIIILLISYIIYMILKSTKSELKEGCYIFEETHPDGGLDYLGMHVESRPEPGHDPFKIGGYVEVTDTNDQLDGKYLIKNIWKDASGRQAAIKVKHNYDYVFTATQGGDPRDITFFGKGRICAV